MKLKVLGSGSSGNCYILESETEALIIEAGLPFIEGKKALDFNVRKIVGVICSHEHKDHSGYIFEYDKAGIPVFRPYESEMEIQKMTYGEFTISSFPLVHDIACYGFYILEPSMGRFIYASDTEYIKWRFKDINNILIEANYSAEHYCDVGDGCGKRNHVLTGHMEIGTTCDFLQANNNAGLRNVILCHLSQDNANPEQFKNRAEKVVNCPVHLAQKGLEIEVGLPF